MNFTQLCQCQSMRVLFIFIILLPQCVCLAAYSVLIHQVQVHQRVLNRQARVPA